jgi:signal transduction histidine kinase
VPDTREVPALWQHWLGLKGGLGVDWDILAFCTRDVRLPDGGLFGTLCVHHTEPRSFSADEQALLEVLARMLGQEIWRERAARELREALAALGTAERRRVELADELRHELRAPLQVIDGYAEGMLDGVVLRDDEHVTLVRHEAGRASQLLDDITELVRLEGRGPAEATVPVEADATVAEMRDRLAPLAESAGVELVAEVAPAAVPIPRKRLEQLVVNLVRNALRAVEGGGGTRIVIFVRPEEAFVAIGVEDDGPGMVADELPRAFERFYRGNSDSDAAQGSGLGLTIARRIVEAAGGEIRAENVLPRGLRVVARLPLQQAVAGGDEPSLETP